MSRILEGKSRVGCALVTLCLSAHIFSGTSLLLLHSLVYAPHAQFARDAAALVAGATRSRRGISLRLSLSLYLSVSLSLSLSVCTYIYTHIYIYIYIYMYVYVNIFYMLSSRATPLRSLRVQPAVAAVFPLVSLSLSLSVSFSLSLSLSLRVCVYIYICILICISIYIYIYVDI